MPNRALVAAFVTLILFSLPRCGNPPNNKPVTVDELAHRGDTLFSLGVRMITGGAGIGDFRSVEPAAKEWIGGGKKKPADPNVYDVILPINR